MVKPADEVLVPLVVVVLLVAVVPLLEVLLFPPPPDFFQGWNPLPTAASANGGGLFEDSLLH